MSNKLTPNEMKKYVVVKQYINKTISRDQAAVMLGVSTKTVTRLKSKIVSQGQEGIVHKTKGKTPINKVEPEIEQKIVDFYLSRYAGWNFEHFIDYVYENKPKATPECFWDISSRTIKRIIIRNNFKSPESHGPSSEKSAHPARYRRENFGELVQLDASIHDWFCLGAEHKVTLHLAIDDATSQIIAAYFDREETLFGYHQVFHQILTAHGIPGTFYTDKRTVFEFHAGKREVEVLTQYMRACRQLGVKIITTSVAQAKGRVERSFRTQQDRLVSELELHGIKTIEEANEYLRKYIPRHNKKFAIPTESVPSSFREIPLKTDLNKVLSIHNERVVLSGNIISFKNKQYLLISEGKTLLAQVREKVTVVQTFDNQLLGIYKGKYYSMQLLRDGKSTAYTPKPNHPWARKENYGKKIIDQRQ